MKEHIEFYALNSYVSRCLNFMGEYAERSSFNLINNTGKDYDGRGGSERFEKNVVKPFLHEHKSELLRFFRESDDNTSFSFMDVIDPEVDESEASKRSWADLILHIDYTSTQGDTTSLHCPVNIKATWGGTSDNVGGWAALGHILSPVNEEPVMTRRAVMDLLDTNMWDLHSPHDYYLWVFYKDEHKSFKGQGSASLLQYPPENFAFNGSQSFPVQVNTKGLLDCKPHPESMSITERKALFLEWLFTRDRDYNAVKAHASNNALTSVAKALRKRT